MNLAEPIALPSATLTSAAYDAPHSILLLEFRTGATYQYFQVPPAIYQELLSAPSKGQYFNRRIRDQFLCSRLP